MASESFADEDWGFLAQQTLEKLLKASLVLKAQDPPRSHSLQRLIQVLEGCGETITPGAGAVGTGRFRRAGTL